MNTFHLVRSLQVVPESSLFPGRGSWGTERLGRMPKVTRLACGWAGVEGEPSRVPCHPWVLPPWPFWTIVPHWTLSFIYVSFQDPVDNWLLFGNYLRQPFTVYKSSPSELEEYSGGTCSLLQEAPESRQVLGESPPHEEGQACTQAQGAHLHPESPPFCTTWPPPPAQRHVGPYCPELEPHGSPGQHRHRWKTVTPAPGHHSDLLGCRRARKKRRFRTNLVGFLLTTLKLGARQRKTRIREQGRHLALNLNHTMSEFPLFRSGCGASL